MAKRSEAYVVDLGQRLMQAKADCKRLQAEWDALFASSPQVDGSSSIGNTVVSRIISLLDNAKGSAFDTDAVMAALGLVNRASTASTLSKLVKQGRIKKYGNDEYTSTLCPIEESIGFSSGDEQEIMEKEVELSSR